MFKRATAICTLICAAAAWGACGGSGVSVAVGNVEETIAVTAEGDFAASVAEGNAHWENRSDRAEVEAAIAAWEEAITYPTPADVERRLALAPVYVSLTRAYYWLSHAHQRWEGGRDNDEVMRGIYEKGMEYGRTAIAAGNTEWNATLTRGGSLADAAVHLTAADVPAAYWYATNAGRFATLDGLSTLLAYKDDIYAIISRCAELDRGYFYNAPDRYFGVYYTKVPFMNPDLDRAQQHFEYAVQQHPQYLETRVLIAEELATKNGDREGAAEHLRAVVAFDLDGAPELRPENEMAQRRAQEILDNMDDYFR